MREIKFRGINNETGNFVYGWYTRLQEGARKFDAIVTDEDGTLTRYYIHERNTIGQFTGLYDKDGVEIYEGDIVLINWVDRRYENVVEVVEWIGEGACFEFGAGATSEVSWSHEVIGNIHQNLELLEEK